MRTPISQNRNTIDVSNLDLLGLGEGQVSYVRKLNRNQLPDLPAEINLEKAWGVFSAKGEPLALCDSINAARHFVADHELLMVALH